MLTTKPNIFIVGATKTGKTAVAKQLADRHGLQLISGSEWVKKQFVGQDPENYLAEITEFSKTKLIENPNACLDYLRASYSLDQGGFVIEGLRNPRDFLNLFRPNIDVIVLLWFEKNPIKPTGFESFGLGVIRSAIAWMKDYSGLTDDRILNYRIDAYRGQSKPCHLREEIPECLASSSWKALGCWNLDEVIEFASASITLTPKPQSSLVHTITEKYVEVAEKVFYNLDEKYYEWVEAKIFGVSSYAGCALSFSILTSNGAIFHNVPLHLVRSSIGEEFYELADLVYFNCPDDRVTVTKYPLLEGPCQVFLKRLEKWVSGHYHCTLDWYQNNQLGHLVWLENGQPALVPSHKMLLGGGRELPPYQKLRTEWKV